MATNSDHDFFREAVEVFSSSIVIEDVMLAAFKFFSKHFPLDGISLHNFNTPDRSQHLLFLVTKDNFYYLDASIPLPASSIAAILEIEKTTTVHIMEQSKGISPAEAQNKLFSKYLPEKNRSRLITILSSNKKIVGHFSILGKTIGCFNREHSRKIEILRPVLGLFMLNLLQFHEISQLKNRLTERNRYLIGRLRYLDHRLIIGEESGLRGVKEMVTQLSGQDIPVLITGETGTGKELIANAVQQVSNRHNEPYVKVNCGAIPETLIDSELFGHEKGAFTGADRVRYGKFEQAKGGTLFLDEIGEMPLNAQVRLLRVLQDGYFERVGGATPILGDVRIIAATNKNLPELVAIGKFRQDLYYRLNVFPIQLPPLRERTQDIPSLAAHFISKKTKQLSLTHTPLIAKESLSILMSYDWPGNVRELENLIERALAIDHHGPLQLHQYLPPLVQDKNNIEKKPESVAKRTHDPLSFDFPDMDSFQDVKNSMPTLDQIMIKTIRQALILCNGQISGSKGAAKMLGINPSTLRKRMNKLKIPYGRN